MGHHRLLPACLGIVALVSISAGSVSSSSPVEFGREIQPILAEHCLRCHGRSEPKGGLDLSDSWSAGHAGESGEVAILPGHPGESELIRRIRSSDPATQMPPTEANRHLTQAEIEAIERWIREGARYTQHWSFEPERTAPSHADPASAAAHSPIDRFVLSGLHAKGFDFSPEADRYTLIRRLYYDLWGLTPSIAEVDRFVADRAPDAYERLVDRLLASPRFGERWGRHWLDLAHYADSDGYEKDNERPDAYLFRDWVIRAINADVPFDRFTVEQLAGDLLPNPTIEQKIATAFLRQTLTNEEGGVDQEEFRVAATFDRTETVGTVWLGLTIGCARCHDHKYDAITQRDYYRLFAFFNDADERSIQVPSDLRGTSDLQSEVAPLEAALDRRHAELAAGALAWETEEHQRLFRQPDRLLTEQLPKSLEVTSATDRDLVFATDREGWTTVGNLTLNDDGSSETDAGRVPSLPDSDEFIVDCAAPTHGLTGFRLHVQPDPRRKGGVLGWSSQGEFLVTGFRAEVVQADGQIRPVPLHWPNSRSSTPEHTAAKVLDDTSDRDGWGIGLASETRHSIEFRTFESIAVSPADRLRVRIAQRHGDRHLMTCFRLMLLDGGERGLDLPSREIANALDSLPEKRTASMRQRLFDFYVQEIVCDERAKELRTGIDAAYAKHRAATMPVRTIGRTRVARTTRVMHRGEFLSVGDAVSASTPAVLPTRSLPDGDATRVELAEWLVSDENPLAARVFVNQVWGHLFGAGIVATPDDFGVRGAAPTHPELLDWLAVTLRNDLRWSRKELIRRIVASRTYRQQSHQRPDCESVDPLNEGLFRQRRFRVESEIVRDLHLDVSGLLSRDIGGPSAFPYLPPDIAKLAFGSELEWVTPKNSTAYRRGMYTFFKRTLPHPDLMAFDSPDANVACVRRNVSNTPLQSLTLLNSNDHIEAAQSFARRVCTEGSGASFSERAEMAWRICLARPPIGVELNELQQLWETAQQYYATHSEEAVALIGSHRVSGMDTAENAGWVVVARTLLNLDEFMTRE